MHGTCRVMRTVVDIKGNEHVMGNGNEALSPLRGAGHGPGYETTMSN